MAMLCQAMAGWAPSQLERQVQSLAQALQHGLMVEHHHHEDGSAVHHDSPEADRVAHMHPSEGFQTVSLAPENWSVTAQRHRQLRITGPELLYQSAALPKRLRPPRGLLQA